MASKIEAAAAAEVSPKTFDGWVARGFIEKAPRGEWNLRAVREAAECVRIFQGIEAAANVGVTAEGEILTPGQVEQGQAMSLMEARAKLTTTQYLHSKIALANVQRQVVEVEPIMRLVDSMFGLIRDHFLALSARVSVQLEAAESGEEQRAIIDSAVRDILHQLSRETIDELVERGDGEGGSGSGMVRVTGGGGGGGRAGDGTGSGGGIAGPRPGGPVRSRPAVASVAGTTRSIGGKRMGRPSQNH